MCAILRSFSVPSELHANLGFCLIKFCVVCGCMYTQTHTTQNFMNPTPKLACNLEGTDEPPAGGTQLPKHVGAAK
jgi:hypothetical protein